MPKIKIFECIEMHLDYDCSATVLSQGITDWDDVTEEEYQLLKDNLWRVNNGRNLVMIKQDPVTIPNRILEIKKMVNEALAKEAADKAERRRKQEEATARKAAKKLENDRKALAKIAAENPDLIKEVLKND